MFIRINTINDCNEVIRIILISYVQLLEMAPFRYNYVAGKKLSNDTALVILRNRVTGKQFRHKHKCMKCAEITKDHVSTTLLRLIAQRGWTRTGLKVPC